MGWRLAHIPWDKGSPGALETLSVRETKSINNFRLTAGGL